MNKYKFTNNKVEFISELRENVKDYFENNKISHYGNSSIVIKSSIMFSLYSVPYIFMLSGLVSSIFFIMLCWMVMGIGMAGLGLVLMHDANHGSFSKNTGTNRWLGKSLYLLGGFPPNWRFQHNTLHHGFTNIDGQDEDIAPAGILRFSPHQPLYKIHKYQYLYAWFFYCLMTLSWVTAKDFKRLYKYKQMNARISSKKGYNQLFIDLILSKIIYYSVFIIIPLLVIPVAWYWIISGFLLMHFISGLILSSIFQTAHVMPTSEYPLPDENGIMDNDWAIHQLHTTSDYSRNSRLFSWLIGGLNYQIEHHLFPYISHVHYRKISILVNNTAQKHNLPYNSQRTFFMALSQHTRMLKTLGR